MDRRWNIDDGDDQYEILYAFHSVAGKGQKLSSQQSRPGSDCKERIHPQQSGSDGTSFSIAGSHELWRGSKVNIRAWRIPIPLPATTKIIFAAKSTRIGLATVRLCRIIVISRSRPHTTDSRPDRWSTNRNTLDRTSVVAHMTC